MQWLIENKDWVFSGIGVAVITIIFGFIFKAKRTTNQSQQSGNESTNYQAANDINIGRKDD